MNIDIKKVKIIVTVPSKNLQEVREAICSEGAGLIGNYSYCTTDTKCIGTYIPSENANPYIGEKNKLEFVKAEGLNGWNSPTYNGNNLDNGKIKFVLLKKIGKAVIDNTVTDQEILDAINEIYFSEEDMMA